MDPAEKQAAKYKSKNLMGYIQDKVDVGMTKLRSDEGVALDVAILKSTLQQPVVPKEKHVVTLKIGSAATAPRQQVNYVIHGLSKRLEEKSGWLVTLKTLIVFHRLLREVDPSFQEELIKYQERTGAHRMLRLDGFADHTTKDTWDYSAWIRVYSVYLDERLGVFKSMRFDPEMATGGHQQHYGQQNNDGTLKDSKLKTCPTPELLDKLPQIQKLLGRLIACVPEGSAQNNEIVLQSCVMVMKELRATYATVCEGIINLADKFFEMERSDALRALDAYKENMLLNEKLNTFLSAINNVPALRGAVQMPALQSLPADFLTTMEEYVRDAPKVLDPSAPNARAGPTGGLRSSTILRQSGTTSANLTGTTAQGVLKIEGPANDTPAPEPTPAPAPPPAPEVDLLGDDLLGSTPTATTQQAAAADPQGFGQPGAAPTQPDPAAAAQQGFGQFPPQQPPQGYGQPPGFGGSPPRPGAPPGAPPGYGFPPQPGFGSPPPPMAGPTGGFNPYHPQQTSPPQPGFSSPPQGPNPFVPGPPFGGPPMPPPNPFAPPGYGAPPGMPPPNPFAPTPGFGPGGVPQYVPQPTGAVNPFGSAGPAWGAGPPQGQAAWGTNVVPGTTALKNTPDPLSAIGADLFGNANKQPVQQSLRDMKQMH